MVFVCFLSVFLSRSKSGELFIRGIYFEQALCHSLGSILVVFPVFQNGLPFQKH